MTTTTNNTLADTIIPPATMSLGYVLALAEDIPADRWADKAIDGMNHPAFLYAHLAIYGNRLLEFVGRTDLVNEVPFDGSKVAAGSECLDDASLYPTKDVVLPYLKERYETVFATLPSVDPEVFAKENPVEGRFREMLPTIGCVAVFMLNNHVMMHAGQISHWRRAIGLGPVM
jgi:hypothetical protein